MGGEMLMPRRKSHFKSQRGQVSGDSQLRQAMVQAGQVPAERSRATSSHGEKVTGGQGVAGSNLAVPNGSRDFLFATAGFRPNTPRGQIGLPSAWLKVQARPGCAATAPTCGGMYVWLPLATASCARPSGSGSVTSSLVPPCAVTAKDAGPERPARETVPRVP